MSGEFNRSGFKATTMQSLDNEKQAAQAAVPNSFSGGRAEFHSVVDGKNWFRIAPSTKPGEPAYRGMATCQLECEVDEYLNGEKTGKKLVKQKKVFIATQHSATMKNDPVLMYLEYVNKKAQDEYPDKTQRQKFLTPVKGYRDGLGKWVWGIEPMSAFVCYAWDNVKKLGRLELRPKWLDEVKRLSVAANEDNSSIVVDIFTDPDEGYPLTIEQTSKLENNRKTTSYVIEKDIPNANKRESWKDFFERVALTDNQLVELMSQESLTDLYYDVYTMRDFNLAVDGLQRFDTKYKYGIFENEEFIERLEILKTTVPADKADDEEEVQNETESPKPANNVSKETNSITESEVAKQDVKNDAPSSTPIPKMKSLIKEYILENYGDDYTMPELTIPQVKEWYQLCKQGDELPFDDFAAKEEPKVEAEVQQKPIEKVVETPVDNSESLSQEDLEMKAKIDALRKKRQEKNQ